MRNFLTENIFKLVLLLFAMLVNSNSGFAAVVVLDTAILDVSTHTDKLANVDGNEKDNWQWDRDTASVTSTGNTSEILVGSSDDVVIVVEVKHTVQAVDGGPTDATIEIQGGNSSFLEVSVEGTVKSKNTSSPAILISGRASSRTMVDTQLGGEIDAGANTNYAIKDTAGGQTEILFYGQSEITGIIDLGGGQDVVQMNAIGGDININGDILMGEGSGVLLLNSQTNDISMTKIDLSQSSSSTTTIETGTGGKVTFDEVVFGNGNDVVNISGNIQIEEKIDLGAGNDSFNFVFKDDADIDDFTIDAGTGNDSIEIEAAGNNALTIDLIDFSDGGSNELVLNGSSAAITLTELRASSEAETITIKGNTSVTEKISLGDGGDTLKIEGSGTIAEDIDLGAGNDTFTFSSTDNVTMSDFTVDAGTGNDNFEITSGGAHSFTVVSLDLSEGDNTVEFNGASGTITVTSMTFGGGNDEFKAKGSTVFSNDIDLSGGNDKFTFEAGGAAGINNRTIKSGDGSDTIDLIASAGSISGLTIDLSGGGSNTVTFTTSGANSIGVAALTCGAGSDNIDVEGNTNITGNIDLGAGNDTFKFTSKDAATINGGAFTVTSGAGDDRIELTADTNSRTASLIDLSGGGANTVVLDTANGATLTVTNITCGADSDTITVSGKTALSNNIDLGGGNDSFTFTSKDGGTIGGNLIGGAGDDSFNITSKTNALTVSSLNAGDGSDKIDFTMDGASLTLTTLTLGDGNDTLTVTGDGATVADSKFTFTNHANLSTSSGSKTLQLDNAYMAGNVTLGAGDTLSALSSAYLAGTVTASGAGNAVRLDSSATLTVAGAVNLTNTDVKVAINDTSAGKLSSTGSVTIAGTSYVSTEVNGYVENEARYTIVEGTGGVAGTFAGVKNSSEGMFLSFNLDYVGNAVQLVAERTPYDSVPLTSDNQKEIAKNLQVASIGATGDMRNVLAQIDQIKDVTTFQAALNQLSPEVYSGNTDANFAVTTAYNSGMAARMGEVRADAGRLGSVVRRRVPYGPSGPTGANPDDMIVGVWAKPFYTWADQDGVGDHLGFTYDSYGVMAGYDRRYGNILLGLSAGYAGTDLDYSGGVSARTNIDTYHLGVYGSYNMGRLYFDSGLSLAINDGNTERMIRIGTVDRTAKGDNDGATYTGFLTAGYNHAMGAWVLTPKATIQASSFQQNGFTETWSSGGTEKNVSGLNLKVDSSSSSSFQSILGFALGRSFDFPNFKLRPEVRMSWMHEYIDAERSVKARFANAPTSSGSFTVEGMKPEADSFGFGIGVTAYLEGSKELFFNFDTEVRGEFTSSTLSSGMRFEF